jgi:predicted Zn-dependent peptidase
MPVLTRSLGGAPPEAVEIPMNRPAPSATRTAAVLVVLLPAMIALPVPGLPGQEPSTSGVVRSGGPDGRDLPVIEHTLENGMHFLLLPRAGAPTVSFVVHVPVGSVHESLGTTGVSHFLEHLLFKGTSTVGTRDLEGEMEFFERMDAVHDTLVRERSRIPEADAAEVQRLTATLRSLEDSARALVVSNEYDLILSRNGARGLNATTSYEATQYFVNLPSNRTRTLVRARS